MRIAVYGGTGMVGSRVVAEASGRGHDVTALSRSGGAIPGTGGGGTGGGGTGAGTGGGGGGGTVTAAVGNAADAGQVAEIAAAHDVVVSAVGPGHTDDLQAFLDAIDNLAANVGDTRLIVVGGAGSLLLPDGTALFDAPGFPEAYQPGARIQGRALEHLRATDGVTWTYLSPAPEIAPGERTGRYVVGDDSPAGESISAEDFAVALVDEIERPAHTGRRFTVASA